MINKLDYHKYEWSITQFRNAVVFRSYDEVYGFLRIFDKTHCKFYLNDDGLILKSDKMYKLDYKDNFNWWRQHTKNDSFSAVQAKIPSGKAEHYRLYEDDLCIDIFLDAGDCFLEFGYLGNPGHPERMIFSSDDGLRVFSARSDDSYWTGRPDRNQEDEAFNLELMGLNLERVYSLFDFVDDLASQISIVGWDEITSPMVFHDGW